MYYTVDAESEGHKQEPPAQVEFIVKNDGKTEKRLTLFEDGEWAEGLSGTFTTPVSDDLPVNNLFLLLKKENDEAEEFLDTICAADPDALHPGIMSLSITRQDGKQTSVPIRSVERGTRSISFYRQSEHQTL